MEDKTFLHNMELIRAAMPYADTSAQSTMELLLKLYEFMHSYRGFVSGSMAACGFAGRKVDLEAMMNSLRPICNKREREIVDRILSIFNAKRMYEMYNTYMSAMKAMQEFNEFNPETSEGDTADNVTGTFSGFDFSSIFGNKAEEGMQEPGHSTDDNMTEMLKGMIPPEQLETFKNLSMLFQAMSYDNNKKSE